MRLSYASYMLAYKDDEAYVAKQMGTSVEMVDQHYREVAFHDDAVRYFNLYPPQHHSYASGDCDYYQSDMR